MGELKLRLSSKSQANQLRNLISKPFEEQRLALKEFVICETAILFPCNTFDRHETAKKVAVALSVEKLIPCILHMKMRLIEKLFQCLVNSALDRYEDGKHDNEKRKECANEVEECMRSRIMGNATSGCLSQWTWQWEAGNRSIKKYNMSGSSADKVMKGLS